MFGDDGAGETRNQVKVAHSTRGRDRLEDEKHRLQHIPLGPEGHAALAQLSAHYAE
jgi:hypothetical protein